MRTKQRFLLYVVTFVLTAFLSTNGTNLFGHQSTAHAATTSGPTISLSSKTAYIGQTLTLTGHGLPPSTPYQLLLANRGNTGYSLGDYIWPDANGDVSQTITFISNFYPVLQGTYLVLLYPEYRNDATPVTAQTSIQVLPTLLSLTGNSGLPITMQGLGFTAFETDKIYFGDAVTGTPEGTTTSDGSGSLSFTFTVPEHLDEGSYPVTIVRPNKTPAAVTAHIKLYPLTLKAPGGAKNQQVVMVHGTGFVPGEYVNLSWDANGGQQLYNDSTDNTGAFKFWFSLPSAPLGPHTLTAQGSTSGLSVSTIMNIGPGISLYSQNGYNAKSNPGGTLTVNGGGFNANEQVNVYFQTTKNGITTATTDSTGSFSTTIQVPFQYSPTTTYYVYAKNTADTAHTRAQFTYVTPTASLTGNSYGADTSEGSVSVAGFGANESVKIVDRYQQSNQTNLITLTTDATGYARANITWPSTPNEGTVPFAAIGQTTGLVATGTHIGWQTIVPQPDNGTDLVGNAGDTLTFTGKNFAASETINITFNDTVVATTTSEADGSYKATFTVPALETVSAGAGNVKVKAVGVTSGLVAGSYYPDAITFYYQPTLTITPTTGPSGTTITVTGAHFPAGVTIPIGWDGPFPYNPNNIGYPPGTYAAVNADQNGSFTQTIQANDLVSGQTYHVTALSYPSYLQIVVTVTFIAQ
ncbi:IPT/TIG domain-containing protein [Dictyobacter formicarum]|uniref:IPT/TIG domain-containing protein n=1 Tax=Dictyobacter formicarum TaxID=2778368 RepID=A0ABQ3VBQ6_9CHLR|nr:IPT/TIG domain-containing protein [Dictyobacter formicarum]GHO83224.1 hypothetical protein KSZ_12300 [Dictyobacter formicarum]